MKNQERFNATIERATEDFLPPHPEAQSTSSRDTIPSPHHSFRDEDDEAFKRFVSRHIPKYKASQSLLDRIKENISEV